MTELITLITLEVEEAGQRAQLAGEFCAKYANVEDIAYIAPEIVDELRFIEFMGGLLRQDAGL